uniref:E3 ubiquitin-protein ligase APD1-4 middle domain-containing protein n=2 Tax=Clastoptera arizonana TaxID=38151 RepID=A0A1B6CL27_9HEMI
MTEESVTAFYHPYKYSSLNGIQKLGTMHGARRVITFCLMTAVLPTILVIIPLYLRHSVYTDIVYSVAESDVLEVVNGISSVFCQAHSLRMNSTFSAFQVSGTPELSPINKKHIKLKKSMKLPDDTLEYWGFYLPQGSRVNLSVCARWDGAHILVVKGDKTLRNCGNPKPGTTGEPHLAKGQGQVLVTYEGRAQEMGHFLDSENKENVEDLKNADDEIPYLMTTEKSTTTEDRKLRHHRKRAGNTRKKRDTLDSERRQKLMKVLLEDDDANHDFNHVREKRRADVLPNHKLDGGIAHGGNAFAFVDKNDSSISSFESNLLECHDGKILLHKEFAPSEFCKNFKYLENGNHLQTTHDVLADGYYYYIFYSDNDFNTNDIHSIFDIYKPTYQYGNYTTACINSTDCTFPIKFFSDDMVVVEVPTRDGIEHESDDITFLVSTCHPRMAVYAIFPVTVLLLILSCAFL